MKHNGRFCNVKMQLFTVYNAFAGLRLGLTMNQGLYISR